MVRKLQTRVKMYDDIFPGIDRLVNSLYALLAISKLEEILPTVRVLWCGVEESCWHITLVCVCVCVYVCVYV
jgi:hypothetical protein